jgi:hypothetical protein
VIIRGKSAEEILVEVVIPAFGDLLLHDAEALIHCLELFGLFLLKTLFLDYLVRLFDI